MCVRSQPPPPRTPFLSPWLIPPHPWKASLFPPSLTAPRFGAAHAVSTVDPLSSCGCFYPNTLLSRRLRHSCPLTVELGTVHDCSSWVPHISHAGSPTSVAEQIPVNLAFDAGFGFTPLPLACLAFPVRLFCSTSFSDTSIETHTCLFLSHFSPRYPMQLVLSAQFSCPWNLIQIILNFSESYLRDSLPASLCPFFFSPGPSVFWKYVSGSQTKH